MFCCCIYGVGCFSGVSYIGWVVMLVVLMEMYLRSSDGDCCDGGCCNGGNCDKE